MNFIELRHSSPRRNFASIMDRGLDPARARGRLKAVWLHTPGRTTRILVHVSERHQVPVDELFTVHVRLPRTLVQRRWRGIYVCYQVIHPMRFFGVDDLVITCT